MANENKFILIRKRPKGSQAGDSCAKISIRREAYDILIDWAEATGCSLSSLASQAVAFAKANELFINEE